MNTPSPFQAEALAGKYGFASQVSAEADVAIAASLTANKITEYRVIDIRNALAFAVETMDEILRDIRNSDTTPESAAARVNAEIAKINRIAHVDIIRELEEKIEDARYEAMECAERAEM